MNNELWQALMLNDYPTLAQSFMASHKRGFAQTGRGGAALGRQAPGLWIVRDRAGSAGPLGP